VPRFPLLKSVNITGNQAAAVLHDKRAVRPAFQGNTPQNQACLVVVNHHNVIVAIGTTLGMRFNGRAFHIAKVYDFRKNLTAHATKKNRVFTVNGSQGFHCLPFQIVVKSKSTVTPIPATKPKRKTLIASTLTPPFPFYRNNARRINAHGMLLQVTFDVRARYIILDGPANL
jgi:hypothetical protein